MAKSENPVPGYKHLLIEPYTPSLGAVVHDFGTFKKQVAEFEYLLRWQILPWLRFPSLHEALH